jgi:hypothetical protein
MWLGNWIEFDEMRGGVALFIVSFLHTSLIWEKLVLMSNNVMYVRQNKTETQKENKR